MLNRTSLQPGKHNSNQLTYESNKNIVLMTEPDDKENLAPSRRTRTSHSIDLTPKKEAHKKKADKSPERALPDKALTTNGFANNLERAKLNMEKLLDSKLPIEIRIKMMNSIRETIQTQLACIEEANKEMKKRILDCEKSSHLSNYICMEQEAKKGNKDVKKLLAFSSLLNSQSNTEDDSRGNFYSATSSEEHIDETSDEYKELESAKQGNLGLEEVVTKLRQVKNSISISIVDLKDDINDFQALMHEKKRVLDNKSKYIEDLKLKISQESAKNSSNIKISPRSEKKEEQVNITSVSTFDPSVTEHITDKSSSNLNSSIFQDVSSKVSDFVGKMFGKKQNNHILTKEVLQEISLNTVSNTTYDPKVLIRRRDPNAVGLKNDLNRHDLV